MRRRANARATRPHHRVSFRDALAVSQFRALWLAQVQSLTGDQLARVAVVVLMFGRTGSAVLTALVYALTFVPAILGGILLTGWADRSSRRRVMIICDVTRAALVAVMALPGVSLPLLCVLLVLVVIIGQPFLAAEAAMLPSLLSGERYIAGSGLRMLTSQLAQLVGFAGGGAAVAAVGARGALVVDAATFVISAALIRWFVRVPTATPKAAVPEREPETRSDHWSGIWTAAAFVWRDQRLRLLAALGWLAAFHVVPEALAAPYAADLGGGAGLVGLLMAAPPAGTALGVYLYLRLPEATRLRLLGPLAVLSAVPLILCALRPGTYTSLLLWLVLGVFAAYQIQASTTFVRLVPDEKRGQVLGWVSSGMTAIQGIGVLAFGALAQPWGAHGSIGFAGACAAVLGLALACSLGRVTIPPVDASAAASEGRPASVPST